MIYDKKPLNKLDLKSQLCEILIICIWSALKSVPGNTELIFSDILTRLQRANNYKINKIISKWKAKSILDIKSV